MSIITIIQIQLIPNCSSQTKEPAWQLTNRTPILMITIIIIINIARVLACVTCRRVVFRKKTYVYWLRNGFPNYLYTLLYCKVCAHERSLEGLRFIGLWLIFTKYIHFLMGHTNHMYPSYPTITPPFDTQVTS